MSSKDLPKEQRSDGKFLVVIYVVDLSKDLVSKRGR